MMQRTIRSAISCRGVGLHTGQQVQMCLNPAPEGTGIIFRRVDLDPVVSISALFDKVGDTRLSTCLVHGSVRIGTIEHIMSAITALGIDNLIIDVDASEIPIMDGSAAPFVFLLQSAGVLEQTEPKQFIYVRAPVRVEGPHGEQAAFTPAAEVSYEVALDFDHPHAAFSSVAQHMTFTLSSQGFQTNIGRARTFGFLQQYEMLKKNGLVRGGSLDNAVVFDAHDMVNTQPLRFDNEPLRHKLLDVIGDLSLAPALVVAKFSGFKTGHAVNNMLLRQLMATPAAWEMVSAADIDKQPVHLMSMVTAI